jgi:hypothetical protein
MTQPLLRFVTLWVVLVIESLRARHRRFIVSVIHSPNPRSPAQMRRMIEGLRRCEARLWREVTEGAMRELSLAYPHRSLASYALPKPRRFEELRVRLLTYRNMLADAERYVRRLVARLRAGIRLSALDRARDCVQPALGDVASIMMHAFAPRLVARAHPAIHPP